MRHRNRLTMFAAGALVAFLLSVSPNLYAQLPGFPSGIGTFTSNIYGWFLGGTWTPNANGGGVMGIATTLNPQTGNALTMSVLDISPTLAYSGTATSINQFSLLHISAPTVVNGGANSLSNIALATFDSPGTAASNNYSTWTRGAHRIDGDLYVGNNVGMALTSGMTITSGTFGTTPTVQGDQYAWQINVGTGATATSGVLVFGTPYTHAPSCWVGGGQAQTAGLSTNPRVTTAGVGSIKISVDTTIPFPSATTLYGGCWGW